MKETKRLCDECKKEIYNFGYLTCLSCPAEYCRECASVKGKLYFSLASTRWSVPASIFVCWECLGPSIEEDKYSSDKKISWGELQALVSAYEEIAKLREDAPVHVAFEAQCKKAEAKAEKLYEKYVTEGESNG